MNNPTKKAIYFYELLEKEEKALISLNLDELDKIRKEKIEYLKWFESLLRDRYTLNSINNDILLKIRKKNMNLAGLYKFSISLFKKEEGGYSKNGAPNTPANLSIKA